MRSIQTLSRCCLLWIGLCSLPATAGASVLSSNLSEAAAGTETASGTTYLAASFTTDADGASAISATLLIEQSAAGSATISVYSNNSIEPLSLVGTLTSPTSYFSSLGETTFFGNLTLAPDTTYWLVLAANTGSYDWAYSATDEGAGDGFTDSFATSDDAGSSWAAYSALPFLMSVETVVSPEPSALSLLAAGLLLRRPKR